VTVLKSRSSVGPTVTASEIGGGRFGSEILPGTTESIESQNNDLSLLGVADCGGPMLLQRTAFSYASPSITSGDQGYMGQLVLTGWSTPSGYTNPSVASDSTMSGQGATAISRTIPTEPIFSSVTFLRELMADGFPSAPGVNAWRERTAAAKASGSEYLNVQFGWLPLVSDMRNFAKSVKDYHEILRDLKAGSGKTTRVGYTFPSTSKMASSKQTIFIYWPGDTGFSSTVSATVVARQETKTWFKGAFQYHLPVPDDTMGKIGYYAELADKLLGVKPTPAAIWDSSPWTWALDWFSNAGDIVHNISALGQNGLALMYGYLMSSSKTVLVINSASRPDIFGGVSAGSVTQTTEWKKRIQANPYGFSVSGSLSNTQKAIIAALGLTRGGGGRR
jgi:hypothetical protein